MQVYVANSKARRARRKLASYVNAICRNATVWHTHLCMVAIPGRCVHRQASYSRVVSLEVTGGLARSAFIASVIAFRALFTPVRGI